MLKRLKRIRIRPCPSNCEGAIAGERIATEPRPVRDPDSFDRKPDPSVLKINTGSAVAIAALQRAITAVWEDANIEEKLIALEGPALGKYFTLRFDGLPDIAARRCRQAFNGLRDRNGTWKKFAVETPLHEHIPVFIGLDKSQKQQVEEKGAKKLSKILAELMQCTYT